jgi:DNA replication protein DnaC
VFQKARVPPEYHRCPKCWEIELRKKLADNGVPDVLVACTLDNWTPGNAEEKQHLEAVRSFALDVSKGFLILLGPVGVGKSHLAVAVMRTFRGQGTFVKQSTLLRQLRATYNDKKADDPIEACQKAPLLVLDEMGLSGGGRDEAPMLNEILDYRYGHLLPTVITSNLDWGTLREELGERLSDRMRECAHAVLIFSGPSHRAEQRDKYFGAKTQPKRERPS